MIKKLYITRVRFDWIEAFWKYIKNLAVQELKCITLFPVILDKFNFEIIKRKTFLIIFR